MTKKPIIYFLCTGNSCRSQMAEGFGRRYLTQWEVYSAGIEAHGVNPQAVQAMAEVGIDISQQTSDVIQIDLLSQADLVVTLCNHAKDVCPITPPGVQKQHWGFIDPAGQDWSVFQEVRNQIEAKIQTFSQLDPQNVLVIR
ncbi:arsenate reductase (thioredoxin) [Vaginisenegalia massiliensis]|uniref:arsenate reductase (thioredoxin) n=1 Tax=Vaginisenegalia massiliensis TaxID=2058294 RepID=UPI000F532D17|nr:arsenate reductase (thioredoxin) [Vaginisenegalia massiliensis]